MNGFNMLTAVWLNVFGGSVKMPPELPRYCPSPASSGGLPVPGTASVSDGEPGAFLKAKYGFSALPRRSCS